MFRFSSLLIIVFTFFLVSLQASTSYWAVQKDHSELLFKIEYLNTAHVTGHFSDISGFIEFEENMRVLDGKIRIGLKSIYTGNSMRDGHLRSKDFFNVEKNPYAFLKLNKPFTLASNNGVEALLELNGVEKEVLIKILNVSSREDTWGYQSRFVQFEATLLRTDFNLTWNKTLDGSKFLVSDNLFISGQLQLQPRHKMTPSSQHKIPDTHVIRNRERFKRGEIKEKDLIKVDEQKARKVVSQKKTQEVATKRQVETVKKVERSQKKLREWLSFVAVFLFGVAGVVWAAIAIKKHNFFSKTKTREIFADVIVIALFMLLSASLFNLMP